MEGNIRNAASKSASILCVGLGWFPKSPGGLERYIYDLTHELAANQDQVELCGVGLPETEPNSPVKLTDLASPDTPIWKRLWTIRHTFKKTRCGIPDAINLHFALYSLPIMDLLPKQVPITFNFHGPWAYESKEEVDEQKLSIFLKAYFVEQITYNRCDRFIVLSKAFGKVLHQQYKISWDKIHIIPGGVDTTRFQPTMTPQEARTQLGWPLDRPILFTSRRLVNRVGLDKLLLAVAEIQPKIPDVWLAIAGKGPLLETLQQQTNELGLSDCVRFLGYLPDSDLPIAYQAADFTVMPSQSFEGFGLAVVESLACGTPVIVTPIGGMPEIIAPFSPNLMTSSPETSDIAEKLEHVLLGKEQVPSREACRQYAVTNFDWRKIALDVRRILLAST